MTDFVRVKVDLGPVKRALIGLRDPDLRGAFNMARKPTRIDQKDHAKRQIGPEDAWPSRAAATVAKQLSGKRRRMPKLLGRLPRALIMKPSRRSLLVVSRVPWSNVHNQGGTAGHGARIPRRTFLWASPALLEHVSRLICHSLSLQWAKVG